MSIDYRLFRIFNGLATHGHLFRALVRGYASNAALIFPLALILIWILPGPDRWTLIISREPQGFHTQYNPRADLGRVELLKRQLSAPVEQLTFTVERAPAGGGTIAMAWEKTEVSVPFKVVK